MPLAIAAWAPASRPTAPSTASTRTAPTSRCLPPVRQASAFGAARQVWCLLAGPDGRAFGMPAGAYPARRFTAGRQRSRHPPPASFMADHCLGFPIPSSWQASATRPALTGTPAPGTCCLPAWSATTCRPTTTMRPTMCWWRCSRPAPTTAGPTATGGEQSCARAGHVGCRQMPGHAAEHTAGLLLLLKVLAGCLR